MASLKFMAALSQAEADERHLQQGLMAGDIVLVRPGQYLVFGSGPMLEGHAIERYRQSLLTDRPG